MHLKKYNLENISSFFKLEGSFLNSSIHTSGHINDTFVLTFKNVEGILTKYILQKINTNIFKNPEELMENIKNITEHISKKLEKEGLDSSKGTLTIVQTKNNKNFYLDSDGNYWRVFLFIDNAKTYMKVEKPEHMYKTGKAIGKFHKQLSDFPIEKLYETIPNFHHTLKRYETFLTCVENNKANRINDVMEEINFIISRGNETRVLIDLLEQKKIPLRVTHNDTKFNNIMIDVHTDEPIAVIDLDTVMPGLSLYDFGDSMRSGASTALEDEKDLSKVNFDLELFEQYSKGYLEEVGETLNNYEISHLPFSAKLITLEQAIRFLGDYLDGDIYYKVNSPTHNLERARNQIKLVKDMENKMYLMENIIKKYR